MIVKNEGKVIKRCLDSVKPLIDYVCISDTGSTDNTVETIHSWLKDNSIEGEVNLNKWESFSANRTKSLAKIRERKDIDYVLIIDADEILIFDKNLKLDLLKKDLKDDLYFLTTKFGNVEYHRAGLLKNQKEFFYKSIIHEYVECNGPYSKSFIDGIYNIPLQDSFRNQNSLKYEKDAEVLEQALKNEKDPYLIQRYTFYLAQSYRDCNQKGKAIYWYNKRAELGGWDQEVYLSLYFIAKLKEDMKYPEDDIVQSYLRAIEICSWRIEAYHGAIKFCRTHGRNMQAYILGNYAKALKVNTSGLFTETWIWNYGFTDEYSIACYWSENYNEGYILCKKLLDKCPDNQKERIKQNLQFFKTKLNLS